MTARPSGALILTHMGLRYSAALLENSVEGLTLALNLYELSCIPRPGDLLRVRLVGEQVREVRARIQAIFNETPEEESGGHLNLRLVCACEPSLA